jgi:putative MATE family efflux protein
MRVVRMRNRLSGPEQIEQLGAFQTRKLRQSDADMTQGVIWKQLLEFSIPMAIGLLFQQFYNTVDTIVVGQFVGKEALAAVGSTGSIVNMLVGLCAGLSTGASVVISQFYGAHDHQKLHDAVHTTILLTFLMCIVATGVGVMIVPPMLRFMATPEDVFSQAQQYLTIYFAGIAGLLVYNMGSGILRAVGDSRRPLYFLCFSALINIAFDLLFVVTFHLGVAGVAYATILSQFLSAVLVLYSLSHTDAPYGIRWKKLRIRKHVLGRILAIGLPSGIQQAVTSFSNVFVQSYINVFGSACMAGWSSYNKLDAFVLIPMQSIALASTTFVGQNYGAKKLDRARKGNSQALIMSLIITAALSLAAVLLARPLMRFFTPDEEVIAYGIRFVTIITPFYVLSCFNQIYAGALRGIGNATAPTLIMLFSFVAFRQLYLFVNARFFDNSFFGMSLAYPLGWLVCSILIVICYRFSALCRPPKAAPAVPEKEQETK